MKVPLNEMDSVSETRVTADFTFLRGGHGETGPPDMLLTSKKTSQ